MLARRSLLFLLLACALLVQGGCVRPDPEVAALAASLTVAPSPGAAESPPAGGGAAIVQPGGSSPAPPAGPTPTPFPTYVGEPTPDPTRPSGGITADTLTHVVNPGETLGYLAQIYDTTIDTLVELNSLVSADFLTAGQTLLVPGSAGETTPSLKLLPDSELVYGPRLQTFDVAGYVAQQGGYLAQHREVVEGRELSGAAIVQLLADRHSVGPRLLLAYIEHRIGWVTGGGALEDPYLFGFRDDPYKGFYWQLSLAADAANFGFYGRSEGGIAGFTLADGTRLAFAADINDGTAGVQYLLGAGDDVSAAGWRADVAAGGFLATYARLFGSPFAYAADPLWPQGLSQPPLTLPWPSGETWYFTGGPHGGWAGGSAWAALDFVPGGDLLGCYESDDWVTAMAPGVVVRSDLGAVVVDLDGDGFAGSGWALVYMHLGTRDRVTAGTYVQTGDPLGHPSCEGGFSNGTHVHIARLYNGRWVAADGAVPLAMDGWVSQGLGREYDGLLVKGDEVREACVCREPLNELTRP